MAEALNWRTEENSRGIVLRVAEALQAGKIVELPTETGPILAVLPFQPDAIVRMMGFGPSDRLCWVVRDEEQVREWVPLMSPVGQRLARRFWPGPLTLAVSARIESSVYRNLPEALRNALAETRLKLRSPEHELLLQLLQLLGVPLVALDLSEEKQEPDTAGLRVVDNPITCPEGSTVVEVDGNSWSVTRLGAIEEKTVRTHSACIVVFVCTGNTCRSPLAEALCKKQLADRLGCKVDELPARGFRIVSAGLAAGMGGTAAAEAINTAREHGADLAHHRSRPLSPILAAEADFLIGMTASHVRGMIDYYPRIGCEPRMLEPEGGDISDPIGQDRSVYRECARQIWQALEPLVDELVRAEQPRHA